MIELLIMDPDDLPEPIKIDKEQLVYKTYETEEQLDIIIKMIEQELSEPYPIMTYRYFVHEWPDLTILAYYEDKCIGCIVNKLEDKKNHKYRPELFTHMLADEADSLYNQEKKKQGYF